MNNLINTSYFTPFQNNPSFLKILIMLKMIYSHSDHYLLNIRQRNEWEFEIHSGPGSGSGLGSGSGSGFRFRV